MGNPFDLTLPQLWLQDKKLLHRQTLKANGYKSLLDYFLHRSL